MPDQITGAKWLVRGADGTLYVISEGNAPVRLTGDAANTAEEILQDAEAELTTRIPDKVASLGSGISLLLTEAFGHH